MTQPTPREEFEHRIIAAWLALPITAARRASRRDRQLVRDLFDRGVPLAYVRAAFRLALQRRAATLPPIRSLYYFVPLLDELLAADPDYVAYLLLPRPTGDCSNFDGFT